VEYGDRTNCSLSEKLAARFQTTPKSNVNRRFRRTVGKIKNEPENSREYLRRPGAEEARDGAT
jgi:hypothetical protein